MYSQDYSSQPAESTTNQISPLENLTAPLSDRRLSLGARILLSFLRRWSGNKGYCWWSIGGITDKVGRCERSVQYWKRELIDAGRIIRIECPGHSDYIIPDPQKFTADLRQFENGNLIPRQARYDPYSWKPPEPTPEQPSLEMQLPEPLKPAEGVQNVAHVKEKMESGQGAFPSAPDPDSFLQEQEGARQTALFNSEIDQSTVKGWMLVFRNEDQGLMLRCISHVTGINQDVINYAWDKLRASRKGAFLRDLAYDFCTNIVRDMLSEAPKSYPLKT